jgi:hypothetical protein
MKESTNLFHDGIQQAYSAYSMNKNNLSELSKAMKGIKSKLSSGMIFIEGQLI